MRILTEGIRAICLFLLLPLFSGEAVSAAGGIYRQKNISGILFRYVSGTVAEWALFQIICVPFVLAEGSFVSVEGIWLVAEIALSLVGLWLFIKRKKKEKESGRQQSTTADTGTRVLLLVILAAFVAIAAFQAGQYFFRMHEDYDDYRFITEAVSAYSHNKLLTENPVTGAYARIGKGDIYKDMVAPWPVWLALVGRFVGIHPAIIAHTVLPVILLLISYAVYALIGHRLFHGNKLRTVLFTFFVALINLFFSGSTDTQSEFTLVRIWQGKAVVAAIIIPAVFLAFLINWEKKTWQSGLLFCLFDLSACLCSSIGMLIVGVETGVLVLYMLLMQKRWKQIWLLPLSILPSLIYMGIYVIIA